MQRLTLVCIACFCSLSVGSLAVAGGDTAKKVEALLQSLTASAPDQRFVAAPVAKAEEALQRSADYQAQSMSKPAQAAEGTALEWAGVAEHLLKSKQIESAASEAELALNQARTELLRARALLEETEARKGRAKAQLAAQPAGVEQ